MNCSNCNVVNFNSGTYETEEIMCENGHLLCAKCYALCKTRCVQCGGRLFDCNENIPIRQHYPNWTFDMINDWAKINENPIPYTNDGYDGEIGDLRDAESMNLLFSRSKSFDGESLDNIKGTTLLDCKSINPNTSDINFQNQHFQEQNSKFVENLEQIEQQTKNLAKKDTRQNLLDQMKEEIRSKIKEEILNLFKNEPRTLTKPEKHMCVKQCKTIGVSTESEPNFSLSKTQSYKGTQEHIVEVINLNTEGPQEYFVMNVDTGHNTNPKLMEKISAKNSSCDKDQPLQQVIETVLQSGTNPMSTMTEDTIFFKMLRDKFSKIAPNKLEKIISSICDADEYKISDQSSIQCQSDLRVEPTKTDFTLISNSSRASYSPPSCHHIASIPNPQFQLIASAAKFPAQTIDAKTLHIPRSPVTCPISSCQQACFVSDFTRHIAVDHTNVPMERILPRQCKNFFLDPKLIHFGSSRCQMLLLVKDKIRNLGHEKFKDFIPVLVMSTRVSTFGLCCTKPEPQYAGAKNINGGFLMIWLTGLMPPQVPIYFSLTVWARTGNKPSCHIVHSGQLYSIRNSQNATTIEESGQRLLLSQNQVDLLTNNGRNMLELQILIN